MSFKKKHRGKNRKKKKSLKFQNDNILPLPNHSNLLCGQVLKNNGNGWYRVKLKSGEYQVQERTGKKNMRARVDDYVLVEYFLEKHYYLCYIYKDNDKRQEIFKTDVLDYLKDDVLENNKNVDVQGDSGGYAIGTIDINGI